MRTPQQIENVNKLIRGFKSLPKNYDHLDMRGYIRNVNSDHVINFKEGDSYLSSRQEDDYFPECSSVACVIGHGPMFGVPIGEHTVIANGETRIIWSKYSWAMFGFIDEPNNSLHHDYDYNYRITHSDWDFCFNQCWSNDIDQVIERLRMANDGRIPSGWQYDHKYKNGVKL